MLKFIINLFEYMVSPTVYSIFLFLFSIVSCLYTNCKNFIFSGFYLIFYMHIYINSYINKNCRFDREKIFLKNFANSCPCPQTAVVIIIESAWKTKITGGKHSGRTKTCRKAYTWRTDGSGRSYKKIYASGIDNHFHYSRRLFQRAGYRRNYFRYIHSPLVQQKQNTARQAQRFYLLYCQEQSQK